jgi:hypothetical protein
MFNLSNTIVYIIQIILFFILINIIIYSIKYITLILQHYIKSLPSYLLKVEGYISDDHKDDCFIFRNAYSNRNEQEYKFILEGVLKTLSSVYSNFPNKEFTLLLIFTEARHHSDIHKLISDPCIFKYNIADPISVNDLFHLIKWNECAFIKNNKDVVATIKLI